MKRVLSKNKIIAEIHPYTDYVNKTGIEYTPAAFAGQLTKNIPASSTGYAGYKSKKYLEQSLLRHIFGHNPKDTRISSQFPEKIITSRIAKTMRAVYSFLPSRTTTKIYVFPTIDPFVRKKMGGVTGFTPYRNTMHLYIHPKAHQKTFLRKIEYTTAHEYHHTVRFQHFPTTSSTLLENMVNEGMAEHFRRAVLDGTKAPWAKALTDKELKKQWGRAQTLLSSRKYSDYQDVFFNDKKFPLWTGYAIGYWIVGLFLKQYPHLSWPELTKTSSRAILKEIERLT